MKHLFKTATVSAAAVLSVGAVYGQSVISAKSGLVHYTEGSVLVDGKPVSGKAGVFAQVNKDGRMTTTEGRAEVLMTPGVFLRVGEQSAIHMISTSLDDTRVAIESGRALLESDTPMKGNVVTLLYKGYAIVPMKPGLFEITTNPPQFKVYSGEAEVTLNGQTMVAKEGKLVNLSAALAQERFPEKDGDDLYRWSKTRSGYISEANASAASTVSGGGYSSFNGLSSIGGYAGNWFYNPAFGMYTYMPFAGTAFSPFGFGLWSPYTVYQAYPYGYNYGNGYYPAAGASAASQTSGSAMVSLVHPVHLPTPPGRSLYNSSTGGGYSSSGSQGTAIGRTSYVAPSSSGSSSMSSASHGGGGSSSGGRGH